MADSAEAVRTYGGWRRTRGIGLMGLSGIQTVTVLGCLLVTIISAAFSWRAFLVLAGPALVITGLGVAQWDGQPVLHAGLQRLRWWRGVAAGWSSYRAGVVVDHPRAWQLPGVLASTRLLDVEDETGRRYGLVWDQRSGTLTATLRCAAHSTWLADRADADTWVSNWHSWLAQLGNTPMVSWVAVTVDTAPDPGYSLRDAVASRLDPAAPQPARELMRDLVTSSPAASADVETRVSVSFDPARSPLPAAGVEEVVAEAGRTLGGLESGLASCGVSVLGRATAPELAGIVRTSFDPASRGEVDSLLSGGPGGAGRLLTWGEAGPVAAEEHWDHYVHDGAASVTWCWHEAPRQQVTSGILGRLLAPGPHPKRVTLLYRPLDAGRAAKALHEQVNAAVFRDSYRRAQGRTETARDRADRERAEQAAREEAMGAGVCLASLYVTVTTDRDDPDGLARAAADVSARADASQLRLRRMYGSQAAGFATTLPAGVCPPFLARRRTGKGV